MREYQQPERQPKYGMTARIGAMLLCAALGAGGAFGQSLPRMDKTVVLPKGKGVEVSGMLLPGGIPATEDTIVSLRWDDHGFEAVFDSVDSAVTATRPRGHDDGLWRDDCVALFLDPGHTHNPAKNADITVSAAGGLRVRRAGAKADFLDGHEPVVERTDAGWRASIRIPWTALGRTPEPNEAWGFNLARIDHEGKTYANMKFMAWTPFDKSFEEMNLWGHVIFAESDVDAGSDRLKTAMDSMQRVHEAILAETVYPNTRNTVRLPKGTPQRLSDFVIKVTGERPRLQTVATLSWDASGLEIGFDCEDDAVFAEPRERDDIKMWRDDCVYVWLDLDHTHSQEGAYIMIQMSASGSLHDARNGKAEWNIEGLKTEVTRADGQWHGRLLIPWSGLDRNEPTPGEAWGINLTRMDHPGKTDYERMENTSWARNALNNDILLDRWGEIVFVGQDAPPDDPATKKGLAAVDAMHAARLETILRPD